MDTMVEKAKEVVNKRLAQAERRRERVEERRAAREWCQRVVGIEEWATTFIPTEIGDVPHAAPAPMGTTAQANGNYRARVVSEQKKANLANFCPKLAGKDRVISVPSVAMDGTRLTVTERSMALHKALNEGGRWVPIVTMSGIKSGTVHAIPLDLAREWWDVLRQYGLRMDKDGRKFAVYAGLIYSEISAPPMVYKNTMILAEGDGEDGNCIVDLLPELKEWFHGKRAGQIRVVEIVDGFPVSFGKGTMAQISRGPSRPALNTSQIKLGRSARVGAVGDFLVAPTDVDSRLAESWISWEPIQSLEDAPAVRQYLARRVKAIVAEMLSIITPERRAELADRLGAIRLNEMGEIEREKRAILDILVSNIPWCQEIETRITRFLIREIVEHVIPSGGISGRRSMMVISNKHGAAYLKPCKENEALVKAIMIRLPHNGPENSVWLAGDPYKKGIGMVVTAEAAAATDGDSDGDQVIVITDPEVIALFVRFTNWALKGRYKPAKTRVECELSADMLEDFVVQQWAEAWWVGGLTTAAAKMAQEKDFETAARLGTLAKLAPMLMKYDISIDGKAFADVVDMEYHSISDQLKKIKLNWHEAADASAEWTSPRELAKAAVEVQSHLDVCWNAAVEAAREWSDATVSKRLSMARLRRLVAEADMTKVSSKDMASAWRMYIRWGQYWRQWFMIKDRKPGYKHPIYKEALEWAMSATPGALAAMMTIMPKNPSKDGFSVKFHTVFAAGRGNEVFGYHPDILAHARAKRGEMWNWLREQQAWCVVARLADEAIA